jgi:hypothetical protein
MLPMLAFYVSVEQLERGIGKTHNPLTEPLHVCELRTTTAMGAVWCRDEGRGLGADATKWADRGGRGARLGF